MCFGFVESGLSVAGRRIRASQVGNPLNLEALKSRALSSKLIAKILSRGQFALNMILR